MTPPSRPRVPRVASTLCRRLTARSTHRKLSVFILCSLGMKFSSSESAANRLIFAGGAPGAFRSCDILEPAAQLVDSGLFDELSTGSAAKQFACGSLFARKGGGSWPEVHRTTHAQYKIRAYPRG